MKKPKISVIIPVYNVEKYVGNCIDSLINQTYDNIECIFVDDCSTDDSYKLISNKISDINNFKLIKNESNRGLSYTRNEGLKYARGEYVSYIDSDDEIDLNYYEKMINSIISSNSDIAVSGMKVVNKYETNTIKCGGISKEDFINNGLAASACNKLFKKEIANKIIFPVGKTNEDVAVIVPALIENKLVYVDDVFYYYYQRENSIQNKAISLKRLDIFETVGDCLKKISTNKNYYKYRDIIVYNQLIMFLIYVVPKDKKFINRYKLLKKASQEMETYGVLKNPYVKEFLDNQNGLHKKYYKFLLQLVEKRNPLIANLLIQFYQTFVKIFRKELVIDANIEDIIKMAKIQKNKNDNKYTISVVIPNYNYKKFLYQRIYSILYQDTKIDELIILDDCSTDGSQELINDLVLKLSPYINVRKILNKRNSGTAFKQWELGFKESKSDYIWIAEADDYSKKGFLKEVFKRVKENTVISYCNTSFINANGQIIIKSITGEIDIMRTGHFDKSFINNGIDEYRDYAFLNCTIANVSSAVFRKKDYKEYFEKANNYKQAGDWIFYVSVMQNGDVSYSKKALNYYRVHGSNVSSVTKKIDHLKEIVSIHDYYDEKFKLNDIQKEKIRERYSFLKKVWNITDGEIK